MPKKAEGTCKIRQTLAKAWSKVFACPFSKCATPISESDPLQSIVNLLPGHVYWYDKSGIFHGCNDQQAKAFGFTKSHELVGKNIYEMETPSDVMSIQKTNELVYQTGEMQTAEESANSFVGCYGEPDMVVLSKKIPWKNAKGEIIGVLGISFDITAEKKLHAQKDRKEKERLAVEVQISQKLLEARDQFKKIAKQVVHDIRSPMASLTMMVDSLSAPSNLERAQLGMKEALSRMDEIVEHLLNSQGETDASNSQGTGSKTDLKFSIANTPAWFAQALVLGPLDQVIIVDDDRSIHTAWDLRFKPILQKTPGISLKHFLKGEEAIAWINQLTMTARAKVFLLTDYELLSQGINGLDVVEQTGISRAVLVTSHYDNEEIQQRALRLGITILPKQIASEVKIHVNLNGQAVEPLQLSTVGANTKTVDVIIVDDEQSFRESLRDYLFLGKSVDCFASPFQLLEVLSQYPKNTLMLLDNQFEGIPLTGIALSFKLKEMGYSRLYILSGHEFSKEELPEGVIAILKTDIQRIRELFL